MLGVLWWGRNIIVYGGLDVLGKAAHDAVVIGQPRTADWIAAQGFGPVARQFIETTFHSFWGQFGWMALPMNHPGWLYPLLWVFTMVVIIGLLADKKGEAIGIDDQNAQTKSGPIASPLRNLQSSILLTTFLLTLTVHLVYNESQEPFAVKVPGPPLLQFRPNWGSMFAGRLRPKAPIQTKPRRARLHGYPVRHADAVLALRCAAPSPKSVAV